MSAFHNFALRTFGKLLVLYPLGVTRNGRQWVTVCECGTVKILESAQLKKVKSCGCWRRENSSRMKLKHGHARKGKISTLYHLYMAIKKRCENPSERRYPTYGGRGIRCEFQSFEEFYATIGDRPGPGYSIDRYPNNNGNYAPGNVRWATAREQANNRRNNISISYNGKTQTIAQWAREIGMSKDALSFRYRAGWSVERMLTAPIQYHHPAPLTDT